MEISYDPEKNERNIRDRGLSFELVLEFEWADALIMEDDRQDYGEQRFQALGYIGDRLHAIVFTPRSKVVHMISLRKANSREVKKYATQK